ncbi:uncharacterized protein LOC134275524 [Saccostrea cucullata]|uniref:uncharacterized protein LOC134275524 n=1 Tax=Saccostrea cuccullata TaxID=36930 RepID=UPI002ED65693
MLTIYEETCSCGGYFFDEKENVCKECPPGYFGRNCLHRCRYPGYGKFCQNVCFCNKEYCDYRSGCVNTRDFNHNLQNQEVMLQENKSTDSNEENENLITASQLTPILIGVIPFLGFVMSAFVGRIIWKKVNPKIVQRSEEAQIERKLNRTIENEDTKEHFYESIDGWKTGESRRDIFPSENNYINRLNFFTKGNKPENRESNHFYDALK